MLLQLIISTKGTKITSHGMRLFFVESRNLWKSFNVKEPVLL
jgi:hypothetical protein